MSKLAIILCAVLFASTANAFSFAETPQRALDTLKKLIDDTISEINEIIVGVKQNRDVLVKTVEPKASELQRKVSSDMSSEVENAKKKINKLIEEVNNFDVSQCSRLGERLQNTSRSALDQVKECFVNKRTTAVSYIENIIETSDNVIAELKAYKVEAHQCIEHIDNMIGVTPAIFCVNKVGAKATWTALKSVPSISVEAVKLTGLIVTLPPTLTFCTTVGAISEFYKESSGIADNTKMCIQQRINEIRESIDDDDSSEEQTTTIV